VKSTEYFLFGTEPREFCPIHTLPFQIPVVTEASFEE
jgi:hypothetical protein